jgi:hypothetical protein
MRTGPIEERGILSLETDVTMLSSSSDGSQLRGAAIGVDYRVVAAEGSAGELRSPR